MADVAIHHPAVQAYEPPLFRTNSKKLGMWLFIMSDSLTFGALLFAYSYGRISNPAWPMPFHSTSIMRASIMTFFLLSSSLTMVLAVAAARHGRMSRQLAGFWPPWPWAPDSWCCTRWSGLG